MVEILFMLIIGICLYAIIVITVFFIQTKLILNPEKLSSDHEFNFSDKFEEFYLTPEKGVRLNCLFFKAESSRGVILYCHGKSRNLDDWGKHYIDFTSKGYDFLIFDYRQFGKSEGRLSERALFSDAKFIYQFLRNSYPSQQIIIYGRSLGSGIATKLANMVKSKYLILETPYTSMVEMAQRIAWYLPIRLIIKYKIPTLKFLKRRTELTHIIHGTEDEFVPFRHSVRLKLSNKKSVKLHPIYGGLHDDLRDFEEYHTILSDILMSMNAKTNS